MDFLIEKNIMKQRKIVIDFGTRNIKVIGCTYTKGEITVNTCYSMSSEPYIDNGELVNIEAFAKEIKGLIKDKAVKNAEITIALPSEMFFNSLFDMGDVASVKELKTEADKEVTNKCNDNNLRASNTAFDWMFLGKRVSQTEEVTNFGLMSAIPKSVSDTLYRAFRANGLKLTCITNAITGAINLSTLYKNDYKHIANLYMDFGSQATRLVAQAEGVCMYMSWVNIGFDHVVESVCNEFGLEYEEAINNLLGQFTVEPERLRDVVEDTILPIKDEVYRVINTCEASYDAHINQIVEVNGFISPSLYPNLYETKDEMDIDSIVFSTDNTVATNQLAIKIDNSAAVTPAYNIAIGCAIAPTINDKMLNKRLNLMLDEHKDKVYGGYINKGMTIGLIVVGILTGVVFGGLGVAKIRSNMLEKTVAEQTKLSSENSRIKNTVTQNSVLLDQFNAKNFHFSDFMSKIMNHKPHSLTLISVDSSDILSTTANVQGGTAKEAAAETNTKKSSSKNETAPETQSTEKSRPRYKEDINSQKIIIRGYSENQADIAAYISFIDSLSCVSDVYIIGIEEKNINEIATDIFEIILTINNEE